MPRPKRSKVAPSVPRVKKAANTKLKEAAPKAPKSPFNDLYDVSDSPERMVRSTRLVRKGNGKGKEKARESENECEFAQARTAPALQASHSPAADCVSVYAGLDLDLGSSSPEVEVGRRGQRTPGVESSVLAIGNFRRRPRQPSILGHAATRHRSSSVESNMAETNGLMSVGKRNTSSLALGNFKSRPRQLSIMGGNTTAGASSSTAGTGVTPKVESALKLGNFMRRAREPSILRTARKEQPQRPAEEQEFEDDEHDFSPDDESTPLNLSRTHNATSSAGASSASRKRKLGSAQNTRSSPRLPSPARVEDEYTIPATYPQGNEEQEDAVPEDEEVLASIEAREETPEPLSETMAPPMSSSPIRSSPVIAARRQPAARGRGAAKTPQARYDEGSDVGSPPSLTHSPNIPLVATVKSKPKEEAPPPSTFSTRQLQALLPRRRRRPARDIFDIGSSGDEVDASRLASDDDELTHMNPRARRRPTIAPSRASRTPAPPTKKKVSKLKTAQKGGLTTYGRGKSSDKENEIDPNDSLAPLPDDEGSENSQELEQRLGKELKNAARKFQEVDQWEMEFEDVTASSSSPKDAR